MKNNSKKKEEIKLYVKAIDNKNIDEIKSFKKNNENTEDIVFEIYSRGLLNQERLEFIIKNESADIKIPSALIKQLLEENKFDLLSTFFQNIRLYDENFILKLLVHRKNNIVLSTSKLKRLIENYTLSKYPDSSVWFDYNRSSYAYIIDACISRKVNFLKYLKNRCEMDVNRVSKKGETPLFFACKSGNLEIVKYLVEQGGADINKIKSYGETPLFRACESGNETIVKYLVEQGAIINKENGRRETPLFYACEHGNKRLVRYLIEQSAEVEINKENFNKETPLFYACKSGNVHLVQYLVGQGADVDVNKENQNRETPLFYACKSGSEALVRYLVEHWGADINKVDRYDETPLFKACESGNKAVVKYLVEHGADIHKMSNNFSRKGETPIFIACLKGHVEVVKYLVEQRGADITKKSDRGKTPFFYASLSENKSMVDYLRAKLKKRNQFNYCCVSVPDSVIFLNQSIIKGKKEE